MAGSPMRYRAKEQVRSQRIGLRLYAIALDPTFQEWERGGGGEGGEEIK